MKKNIFEPYRMHDFLVGLKANNSKQWMDKHREEYQVIRVQFLDFVESVHAQMLGVDSVLVHTDPRKSLFRINRDIRFSADKTPYKTHMGAKFSATGKKKGIAGYGFGISADGYLYIMGGINKLPPSELNLIRDALVTKNSKLAASINAKTFTQTFELSDLGFGVLKTVPRRYDKNSPLANILKLQAYWAMHRYPLIRDKKIDEEFLLKYTVKKLSLLKDFVLEINRAIL